MTFKGVCVEETDALTSEIQNQAFMKIELHEIEPETKYVVVASYISGSKFAFYETWKTMRTKFLNDNATANTENE